MAFDPYVEWLKLPADGRRGNLYELLGLSDLEEDVERIRQEAMQRIAHVRKYQLGEHSEAAIRMLGELSAAFDTLTTPDRKQAYDALLRGPVTGPMGEPGPPVDAGARFEISHEPIAVRQTKRPAAKASRLPWAISGVLVAGVAAGIVYSGRAPATVPARPKPIPTNTSAIPSPQPAPPPAAPLPAPPTPIWKPLFASPADVPARRGIKLNGNVLELDSATLDEKSVLAGNCILRAKVKKLPGQNISLRVRKSDDGYYAAWFNGGRWFGVGKGNSRGWVDLKQAHTPKAYDNWFEFKFAAVGDRLTVWADGEKVLSVRDGSYTSGSPGLGATRGRGLFRAVEIQVSPE